MHKRIVFVVAGVLTLAGGGVASAALSGGDTGDTTGSATTTTATDDTTPTTNAPTTTTPPTTAAPAPAAGTTDAVPSGGSGVERSYDGCTDATGAPFTTGNHGQYVSGYAHAGGDVATAAHSDCGMPTSAAHDDSADPGDGSPTPETETPETEPPETETAGVQHGTSTGQAGESGRGNGHGGS